MAIGAGSGGRRSVTILGSTGSVGCSTIDLIERQPENFTVEALTAHRNVALLAEQARRLRAGLAVVSDPSCYAALKEALSGTGIEVAAGPEAVAEAAARPAEWVMAAIVGAAGLAPTLAAIRRGAAIAFANKEVLVCAGPLVMAEVARHGATLLPVDSEHNAIFQVFEANRREAIERIILTASGGPFRDRSYEAMRRVTPAEAVAHPNWRMGAKISVDSATMMNKGLELIEAHHLFGLPNDRMDVVVHPQSIIHGLVAYSDGSFLAQLGSPDMRTPIAYALAWPKRMGSPSPKLDLATIAKLTFEAPDETRFPALRLARAALDRGGAAPTILNAANEVAVHAFLAGGIGFLDIASIVERTLELIPDDGIASLDDVYNFDSEARRVAAELFGGAARTPPVAVAV
ncbi:MAG TPA: 1-deoxy-D-xylulose-5-phosphate reductoisomerase [Stellaceae bacterium]|jgi:1-deoxy-D-xylulose-5-phosphate reductoisomerase